MISSAPLAGPGKSVNLLKRPPFSKLSQRGLKKEERMIAGIIKVINVLSTAGGHIASVLVLAMLVLYWVEIGGRTIFNWSTYICEEYSAYFLVGLTMGFAHTLKTGGHIRINVFISRLSPRIQSALEIFISILSIAFLAYFAFYIGGLVIQSFQDNVQSLSVVRTPLFIPQSALLIGIVILMLQFVTHILKKFERNG
jgi:TRAP-type C4-dicarboxylate transport system permease small subunit